MENKHWAIVNKQGVKALATKGKEYLIVTKMMTDFCKQAIVSAGAGDRELLTLDPNSTFLEQQYQTLKTSIETENHKQGRTLNPSEIFAIVIKFIREQNFKVKSNNLENDILQLYKNWPGERYESNPMIPIDYFLEKGIGLCRHHALYLSFLLNRLMNDKLLPAGKIHHLRHTFLKGSAHVWVMYQPDSQPKKLFLLDSLWNVATDIISPTMKEQQRLSGYGDDALQRCRNLFSHISIRPSYDSLNKKEQKYFLLELLKLNENDCKEVLYKQHAKNKYNLINIQNGLEELDKKNANPNKVGILKILKDISETNKVFKREYQSIKESDSRQQFVLSLLSLPTSSQDGILANQSIPSQTELLNSLKSTLWNRQPLYERFESYNTLIQKITDSLNEKEKRRLLDDYSNLNQIDRREKLNKLYVEDNNKFNWILGLLSKIDESITPKKLALLEDMKRINNADKLHQYNYSEILHPDERQQFILRLLTLDQGAREKVLAIQCKNIANLRELRYSLTSVGPDCSSFYQRFSYYHELLSRIDVLHKKEETKSYSQELYNIINVNERREKLNKEYRTHGYLIDAIYQDLTHATDLSLDVNSVSIREDIRRLKETANLHKQYYTDITNNDDKQQFVLGLLMLDDQDRAKVLRLQSTSIYTINQLRMTLVAFHDGRQKLYQKFDNYDNLRKELDRISQEYEAKQFIDCLTTYIQQHKWQVGFQIKSCFIEKTRVPQNVAKQYAIIPKACKDELSFVEAKKQIIQIGKRESQRFSFFRKADTKKYYALFKEGNERELYNEINYVPLTNTFR